MIKHCLGNSQINRHQSKEFLRIKLNFSLQNKRKSLRVQPGRADIIHSQHEIRCKEIFDPEKHTFSINSERKST